MKKILLSTLAVGGMVFGNFAMAAAIPADIGIDFRDASWSGAYGNNPYTVDGITATATGGWNRLHQDNRDGLGIMGGEFDEIDASEILTLSMDGNFYNTHGLLTGLWLTDLFSAPDGSGQGESGWVVLYDAALQLIGEYFFAAQEWVVNGEYYVDFGGALEAYSIEFFAADANRNYLAGNEFSVAGFMTSIPEPGTLALLGVGLLMLGFARRRQGASTL